MKEYKLLDVSKIYWEMGEMDVGEEARRVFSMSRNPQKFSGYYIKSSGTKNSEQKLHLISFYEDSHCQRIFKVQNGFFGGMLNQERTFKENELDEAKELFYDYLDSALSHNLIQLESVAKYKIRLTKQE